MDLLCAMSRESSLVARFYQGVQRRIDRCGRINRAVECHEDLADEISAASVGGGRSLRPVPATGAVTVALVVSLTV